MFGENRPRYYWNYHKQLWSLLASKPELSKGDAIRILSEKENVSGSLFCTCYSQYQLFDYDKDPEPFVCHTRYCPLSWTFKGWHYEPWIITGCQYRQALTYSEKHPFRKKKFKKRKIFRESIKDNIYFRWLYEKNLREKAAYARMILLQDLSENAYQFYRIIE